MKKNIITILAYIGPINFIVVICVILLMFFIDDPHILRFLSDAFAGYIRISFLSAIVSMISARRLENKKLSSFIFNINVIYLVLYVIGFAWVAYLKMHG